MTDERDHATYRFGALERRGFAGGLRVSQVIALACASLLAVAIFRRWPSTGGLALAALVLLLACAVSWVPVHGRGADEWIGVCAGWLWLLLGGRRYRSPVPTFGTTVDLTTRTRSARRGLPPALGGVSVEGTRLTDGGDIGVFVDGHSDTLTTVLSVRVRSFALLAAADQERRLLRWGRAVASLARTGSAIRRLQVLERTVPHDEHELRRWLEDGADAAYATNHPVRASYESLVDGAADVTQDHEVLLALQIDGRRARGDGRQVLLREIRALADQLDGADAGVVGALPTADCLAVLRTGFAPFERPVNRDHPPGPIAAEPAWDHLRTDDTLHRTFWVAQWPRLGVGPAFLAPMLLTATAVRSFSVVVEPVPPLRSRRAVEAAITSDEADEQLRRERGFRTPARRREQQAATMRREAELAEGHEEVRFAGYVTVSGRNATELARNCDEVLQAAQHAYLDLQSMWGQQDSAFVCGALPLCHGLAPASLMER